MNKSVGICGIAAILGAATFPASARAQVAANGDPPTSPTAGENQVEEIIVTARKRSESLQDAPVSVTAFSAEALERTGSTDINDIAKRTPGFQYGNFGDQKLSPLSLRGILGSSGSAGADPAVGIYIDEVFVGQGAGSSLDLFDIERVEVLRGPQGTLYGRNTIGGLVNVITRRPSRTTEVEAEAGYGSYDRFRAGALVTGPVIPDKLFFKVSGIVDVRDGYFKNLQLNRRINDEDSWTIRGQVLLTPTPDVELTITGEKRKVDQEQLAFETLNYDETKLLPQLLDAFGLPRNSNPFDRKVYSDIIPEEKLDLWGVSANLKAQIGTVELTNIASYRAHDYFSRSDTDRSPLRLVYDGDPERVWRFSEELRLGFRTGPVQWLIGGYYFRQRTNNLSFVEVGADLAEQIFGDASLTGLRLGSKAILDTDSYAAFGNLDWQAAPKLTFSLGGRFTHEKKAIDYTQTDPLDFLGGDFAIQAHDSWSQFTPSGNVRYFFSDDVTGYATVSKGFKSGGFNDALGNADGISFDPEALWNYEAGLKTRLFDRRVTANFAAYYMSWDDIQITLDNPSTPTYDPIILNAGKAHSLGFEAEIDARVTKRWRAGGNLSVQKARFDEGTLPTGEPLHRLPLAPTYSAALSSEYRLPVGFADLSFFGEALFRGNSYLGYTNSKAGQTGSYILLNGRIALAGHDDRWELSVYGDNLTNKIVKTRLFDLTNSDLIGQTFIALSEPRTVGVRLRGRY